MLLIVGGTLRREGYEPACTAGSRVPLWGIERNENPSWTKAGAHSGPALPRVRAEKRRRTAPGHVGTTQPGEGAYKRSKRELKRAVRSDLWSSHPEVDPETDQMQSIADTCWCEEWRDETVLHDRKSCSGRDSRDGSANSGTKERCATHHRRTETNTIVSSCGEIYNPNL